jgi:hypothetical protein
LWRFVWRTELEEAYRDRVSPALALIKFLGF